MANNKDLVKILDSLQLASKALRFGWDNVAKNAIGEINKVYANSGVHFYIKNSCLAIILPEGMGIYDIPFTSQAAFIASYISVVDNIGREVKILKNRFS